MALTPEDVVNKRFQPTKFREGYDQDEVDDFLDEVVLELRRLNQEGEELRQRLVASEARIAELQRGGGQSAGLTDQLQQQVPAAPAVAATTGGLPYPSQSLDASSLDPGNTNNLLQLARRLHEEHVREGIEKRDALIAEAEAKQRSQISSLEQERALLEHSIDELRSFERDYRQKLKSYIESQLAELNGAAGASTGGVAVQAAESQPTSFQGFGGI